jgi:hypothetical protein
LGGEPLGGEEKAAKAGSYSRAPVKELEEVRERREEGIPYLISFSVVDQ